MGLHHLGGEKGDKRRISVDEDHPRFIQSRNILELGPCSHRSPYSILGWPCPLRDISRSALSPPRETQNFAYLVRYGGCTENGLQISLDFTLGLLIKAFSAAVLLIILWHWFVFLLAIPNNCRVEGKGRICIPLWQPLCHSGKLPTK